MALQMDRHSPLSASSEKRLTKAQPLQAGVIAPDFNLHSTPDQTVSLSDFLGRPTVLMFYPADCSPVCGVELSLFNELIEELAGHQAWLAGISVVGAWCHAAFAENRK